MSTMALESLDFVLSSETRLKVLSFLSKDAGTPTQLARQVEKHLSHISRALRSIWTGSTQAEQRDF